MPNGDVYHHCSDDRNPDDGGSVTGAIPSTANCGKYVKTKQQSKERTTSVDIKGRYTQRGIKRSDTAKIILISISAWHVGCRWFTLEFHVRTIDIQVTIHHMRLRWSRGSVLAFGTQVLGFKPDRSRWIFQGEKILSTPSFGGEVKSFVP